MLIRLTLVLTFLNFVGVAALRVVLTLYALNLGASPSAVGLLAGIFYVFPLLLSIPIGSLADRRGPRGLLIFGSICGTCALVLPYFFRQVPAFYIAAALSGLSVAFNHVTMQNLVGVLSKPDERPRNFSNFSLMGAVCNFVGPLIAGFSIDTFGHAAASLAVAAISLGAIVLLAIWGGRLPGGTRDPAGASGSAFTSLKDRAVWRMLATSGLVQLGNDVFQVYLPIYGHAKGFSASAIGAVLASFASAAFLVRLYLARLVKRFPPEKLLANSFYAGAAGLLLVPFLDHVATVALIAFIFGLGMGVGTPLSVMLMFSTSAEGRSGQTLGLRLTVNNLVRVTGPMLFGAIGTAFGLPSVFWISALVLGSGGLLARKDAAAPRS